MKICIWLFNTDKINFDHYGHLNLAILSSSPHYPLAQQSCGGDIGSVPYVCM